MEASYARGRSICEREQVVVLDQLNSNVRDKTLCLGRLGVFEGSCRELCVEFWQGWERLEYDLHRWVGSWHFKRKGKSVWTPFVLGRYF